jgi:hypothetical protein
MNKPAAIYARVSSDRQKENQTIASQTAALQEYAVAHGYLVPAQWVFEDEGYSGASLIRPGLETMRDLVHRQYPSAANNRVKNRTSFRDTFAQDRRWSVRLIARSWTAPRFRLPQSPDARIKQKMSAVGMTALSEQNGQRQITPPAVRNDDEVHQLGQS